MAKKAKTQEVEIKDDELLGTVEVVETKEEVKAVIKPAKKELTMIGFHPITGEEVWM